MVANTKTAVTSAMIPPREKDNKIANSTTASAADNRAIGKEAATLGGERRRDAAAVHSPSALTNHPTSGPTPSTRKLAKWLRFAKLPVAKELVERYGCS